MQAQVHNLLNDLKAAFKFTALFISHGLSVVRYISDQIIMMQKGKMVEIGDANYTKELINAIPKGVIQ